MKKYLTVVVTVLSLLFHDLSAKELVFQQPSDSGKWSAAINDSITNVQIGYGIRSQRNLTGSIIELNADQFNQGNINDPLMLIQGKAAGLSIYQRGSNPNSSRSDQTIRIRGLTTFGSNLEPLIVIDGVIGASLRNVDPNDIASFQVLKDGAATAVYGIRASNGVILVTTKTGKRGKPIQTEYHTYFSVANTLRYWPSMNATQYTVAGGNDLGAETDWQREVTRTSLSNVHNISIAGGGTQTVYRFSANFRDINGILETSGFDQFNSRANITHYALNDKLTLNFNASLTNRESNLAFNEAFRYAVLYNPTSPIFFENGNYSQAILFDNFNPEAILKQNQNLAKEKLLNINLQGSYQVTEKLRIHASYANQFINWIGGEYYPASSFFRGQYRNGLAERTVADEQFTFFETYGQYQTQFNNNKLGITLGYSFQEDQNEQFSVSLGNFPSEDVGFNILESAGDLVLGNELVNVQSDVSPVNRVVGFFTRATYDIDDFIYFNGSLRVDGSTKLGNANNWGVFPSMSTGIDLRRFWKLAYFDYMNFRMGWGVTGLLPLESGLSQDTYAYDFRNGGSVFKTRDANPDLKWEKKAELNLGFDVASSDGRLTGSVDLYLRSMTDIIMEEFEDTGEANFINRNMGELETGGIDFYLNYHMAEVGDLSWTAGLNVHRSYTELRALREGFTSILDTNPGAPGQGSTTLTRLAVNEEIGQLWGAVFTGEVDNNGLPIFEDVNGDGVIETFISDPQGLNADYDLLGNGNPDIEIGISNLITYQNWDFNFFFRGAFGHSLVNLMRMFYESIDPGAINSYNRIDSKKSVPGLTVSQYSSLYVERADFLKLDNATVGYTLDFQERKHLNSIRFYFTVQNAFVLTGYTGVDPEPILVDYGTVDNGNQRRLQADVFSPGIDRRNNYFTARNFTLGISVKF